MLDAMNQSFLALLDQPDVLPCVFDGLARDLRDLGVLPPFIAKPLDLTGKIHRSRFGASDILHQRLQVSLFPRTGNDFR